MQILVRYRENEKIKLVLLGVIGISLGFLSSQLMIKYQIATLALMLISFFVALFLLSPKISFLFLFFVRPIIDLFWDKPVPFFENPLHLVGGLAVICIIIFLLVKKINFSSIPYSNIVILFLLSQSAAFFMAGFANSAAWPGGLVILLKIINGFLFFFALPFIFKTRKNIEYLIDILFFSTIIPMLITFYVWFKGDPGIFAPYFTGGAEIGRGIFIQCRGITRLSGLYQGTFAVAFHSLLVLFLGLFKLQHLKNQKWKLPLLIYMGASLLPLYQTYLRTGWSMALTGLGLWFFLKGKKPYLFLLIGGAILLFYFSETAQFRFGEEFDALTGQQELKYFGTGRGYQWERYIDAYLHQFSPMEKLFGKMGAIGRPENQILYLLVTSGFIGLLSYLIMMTSITYGLFRSFKYESDVYFKNFSLLALVLHLAFIMAWVGGTPLLWVNAQWVVWTIIGIVLYQSRFVHLLPKKELLDYTNKI